MPGFRDDLMIVIELGSHTTKASFSLGESLGTPQHRIRTRVGVLQPDAQSSEGTALEYLFDKELDSAISSGEYGNRLKVTYPVERGCIKDFAALEALWRYILFTLLDRPYPPTVHNSYSPVLLITSAQISSSEREDIAKLFFEEFCCPGFAMYENSICALYAAGVTTGLVIDIGYEKTDLTPIVDSAIVDQAQITLPLGGRHITLGLMNLLKNNPPRIITSSEAPPQAEQPEGDPVEVTEEMAEEIKLSEVTEIVIAGYKAETSGTQRDEGVDDIASIVASGKMEEYLKRKEEERAQRKGADKNVAGSKESVNVNMIYNTVKLSDSREIAVGPERFHTGRQIIEGLNDEIGIVDAAHRIVEILMMSVDGFSERVQELWQNLVVVGGGARVRGLKPVLAAAITNKYVSKNVGGVNPMDAYPTSGAATPNMSSATGTSTPVPQQGHSGNSFAETDVRILKVPDFFVEWRDAVMEEMTFLGGEILAHVGFADSTARNYLSRSDYHSAGPQAIGIE